METKLIVEALKREAEVNPASKAALMVFAVRKRPRSTLTLVGLEHRMQREGFKYEKAQFVSLLTAMANVGIGDPVKDAKGKIVGLKNIHTTFQSIGNAVCGDGQELETFKLRNKFNKIPTPRRPQVIPKPPSIAETTKGLTVNLEIYINGKSVRIPVPTDLTNEDIMTLISRFKVS